MKKDSENDQIKHVFTRETLNPLPYFNHFFYYFIFLNFQEEDGGRLSEKNGGIATTAKIRRTRRDDGRGRERGSERGRETQVNEKTLTTRTKRSTGIAEAMTQTRSPPQSALYSSAPNRQSLAPPHLPPLILTFFLLQNFPTLTHLFIPPWPLSAGVLLLPVWFEYNVYAQVGWDTFSHKAWATIGFKKVFFFLPCSLYSFTSTTKIASQLKSAEDTAETAVETEEQSEKCLWLCGGLADRQRERQRRYTMCLLIWLFNGALVQHCASWFLNVDFATLCRTIVYYCCSCSLDLFILFGAEFLKKE